MARDLGTHTIDASSPYTAAFEAVVAASPARLDDAGDPDDVAAAIEAALRAPEPPARVVVGPDAQRFVELVASLDAEGLGALLRDFVTGLTRPTS